MRSGVCVREDELLAALKSCRWPDGCDHALREHVESCASCAQLLELAQALLDDHRALVAEAQVPSSAIVWWRAQMRSRREAAQVVTQPITFVQGLIVACLAGLTVAAIGFFVPTFRRAGTWLLTADVLPQFSWSLPSVTMTSPITVAAFAALALCAIILPFALYLTFQEEE